MPIRQALLARASAASTSPEPFASHVDILTAAQDMETAIHARSGLAAAAAIRSAQAQVLHAAAYLKLAGAPALSAQGAALAKQLAALAAAAAGKSGSALAAYQGQTLYAFQGQLRAFNASVRALGRRGAAIGAVSLGRPRPRRGRGLYATSGVLTITPGQSVALPVTVTVSASFPVYWSCAVQAVDQSGTVLAQATKQASGSASFDLTLGPLNTAGAQVSFRGTLNAYADAAMTQAIPGSPATASTGVEVAVQGAASFSTGISSVSGAVGSPAQATITVKNTGGGPGATVVSGVLVAGGVVQGHMTSVNTGTLQPGASQTLTMTSAGSLSSEFAGTTLELAIAPGTAMASAAAGSAFPQGLPGESGYNFVVAASGSGGSGTGAGGSGGGGSTAPLSISVPGSVAAGSTLILTVSFNGAPAGATVSGTVSAAGGYLAYIPAQSLNPTGAASGAADISVYIPPSWGGRAATVTVSAFGQSAQGTVQVGAGAVQQGNASFAVTALGFLAPPVAGSPLDMNGTIKNVGGASGGATASGWVAVVSSGLVVSILYSNGTIVLGPGGYGPISITGNPIPAAYAGQTLVAIMVPNGISGFPAVGGPSPSLQGIFGVGYKQFVLGS